MHKCTVNTATVHNKSMYWEANHHLSSVCGHCQQECILRGSVPTISVPQEIVKLQQASRSDF